MLKRLYCSNKVYVINIRYFGNNNKVHSSFVIVKYLTAVGSELSNILSNMWHDMCQTLNNSRKFYSFY